VKFVMFILFLFSILSWAIIFMKWRLLRKAREETTYFLDLFWDTTEMTKVYSESEDLPHSPVANLFRSGYSEIVRMSKIQAQPKGRAGNSTMQPLLDVVERSLRKATIDQGNRWRRRSLSGHDREHGPIYRALRHSLGHYGILQGHWTQGAANLAVVAPGISEALIATAAGLAAAIPASWPSTSLTARLHFSKSEMDNFSSDFLSLVERQFMKKMMDKPETGEDKRRTRSEGRGSEVRNKPQKR